MSTPCTMQIAQIRVAVAIRPLSKLFLSSIVFWGSATFYWAGGTSTCTEVQVVEVGACGSRLKSYHVRGLFLNTVFIR